MLGILSRIFARKVSEKVTADPPRPVMVVPLGLSPGSVWTVPDLELELARSDGSLIKAPRGDLIVGKVGRGTLFGMDVWHIRFKGEDTILQVVTQGGNLDKVQQLRVFGLHATVTPATRNDWEFWLGRARRDQEGRAMRDPQGGVVMAEPGLIGGDAFQIDGPPPAVYNRQWPGHGDKAVRFEETIEDEDLNRQVLVHEGMEYARYLGESQGSTVEYLYAVAHGALGHVKIYLGIDLDPGTQKVISLR